MHGGDSPARSSMEEDKSGVTPVITIRAATPERLIQLCVNAFSKHNMADMFPFLLADP